MSSETKAAVCIIAGMAGIAFAVAMAMQFGLIFLFIIIPVVLVLIVKYGIIPIIKGTLEIADRTVEIAVKIREARQPYFQAQADLNGNYSQVLDRRTGQIITLLTPGNAPVAQIAGPRNAYYADSVIDADIEEEEILEIGPGGIDPLTAVAPTFKEELDAGRMEPGDPCIFGYRIVTDPFTRVTTLEPITDAHEATMFLLGASTVGKSTLLAGVLARRARVQSNIAYLILDPHKGNKDRSIASKILPGLEDWLITPKGGVKITGKNAREVQAAVNFLKEQRELRLYRDDLTDEQKRTISPYYDLQIWVIIDECLSYARETRISGHDKAYDELVEMMQSIATETAKAGITGVFMTQLGTKDQLGDMEIRDVCPAQVILRTPRVQGLALGMTAAEANTADRFPKGRGQFKLYDGYDTFVWCYCDSSDVVNALEGIQSPLIQPWKTQGSKIVDFTSHTSREEASNRDVNGLVTMFPPALQEALQQIPDYANKLAILEEMIGAGRPEIWQALFNKAPGGRNAEKTSIEVKTYDILTEVIRFKYRQLRDGNGGF